MANNKYLWVNKRTKGSGREEREGKRGKGRENREMSFPSKSLHRMKHFVSYWNKTYQSVTALICIYSNFVAQRQVGETALNDKSSRSHQIVRLVLHSSYCICSCLDSLQPLLSNIFHHLSLLK